MAVATPEFLVVQVPRDGTGRGLEAAASAIRLGRGRVLAAGTADEVELLEPGTPAASLLVARWESREDFDDAWSGRVSEAVDELGEGVVLSVPGLPVEGLPEQLEIPTVASVEAPELPTPPTYMVVQGSASDPDRIGRYRDIILPMLKERSAYYIVFSIAKDEMRVLRGSWSEQIFAISRWPTHESAHDFWFCDRYQKVAVPARTGAGDFKVHLLRGREG